MKYILEYLTFYKKVLAESSTVILVLLNKKLMSRNLVRVFFFFSLLIEWKNTDDLEVKDMYQYINFL